MKNITDCCCFLNYLPSCKSYCYTKCGMIYDVASPGCQTRDPLIIGRAILNTTPQALGTYLYHECKKIGGIFLARQRARLIVTFEFCLLQITGITLLETQV